MYNDRRNSCEDVCVILQRILVAEARDCRGFAARIWIRRVKKKENLSGRLWVPIFAQMMPCGCAFLPISRVAELNKSSSVRFQSYSPYYGV